MKITYTTKVLIEVDEEIMDCLENNSDIEKYNFGLDDSYQFYFKDFHSIISPISNKDGLKDKLLEVYRKIYREIDTDNNNVIITFVEG